VKFVAVSDTHTYHWDTYLPEGEVLLHTGDFTGNFDEDLDLN